MKTKEQRAEHERQRYANDPEYRERRLELARKRHAEHGRDRNVKLRKRVAAVIEHLGIGGPDLSWSYFSRLIDDADLKNTDGGSCKGMNIDLFYPDLTPGLGVLTVDPNEEVVLSICNSCPVQLECLSWALKNGEQGYWGGVSGEKDFRELRRLVKTNREVCEDTSTGQPVVIKRKRVA